MKKNFTLLLSIFPLININRYSKGIFKTCLAFVFFFLALQNTSFAQPTVLGTQLVNGGYTTYNLNPVGGFKQVRILALNNAIASSLNWEFCQ
ncbi:MAG: hypothetical protein V4685_15005, partial [Bacteroidota bacterium]